MTRRTITVSAGHTPPGRRRHAEQAAGPEIPRPARSGGRSVRPGLSVRHVVTAAAVVVGVVADAPDAYARPVVRPVPVPVRGPAARTVDRVRGVEVPGGRRIRHVASEEVHL